MEPTSAFERLVGDWIGDEQIGASAWSDAGTAHSRLSFHPVCDGAFLAVEYDEDGGPSMKGHGVIGFDKKAQAYTLHWFDNAGAPPSTYARGTFENGVLAFEHDYGGHLGRTVFALDDTTLSFRVEMKKPEADWSTVVDGVLVRVDDAVTIEDVRAST